MREAAILTTTPGEWRGLAEKLRGEGFDQLCDLTCVDWHPEPDRFEIVCQLHNTRTLTWQRIKTRCSEDAPPPTLSTLWPAANWFEREVYDLFGVRFLGHPNLTRMLMPDDWQGHPLRKDYPVEGYR
ncbi:MAG: NADH-quinone oxidoreductase subunit C [Terriglobales bacterium]